ncbi:hypothetical protein CVT26_007213 [Gymnopilus dilepis]|uniref:Uncharacterized protein n=1 Tax=Gymnopilus dilepis TaxID=231916 RepID=A0A409W6J5_9AGAR|nr:hypothetical protein CVT26_007213 [Gymnopilus dilepis]
MSFTSQQFSCDLTAFLVTQEQYNIVKDIILDLLGWGVPFDYLVQCGVSREAIFYVFTELNLRIPESFDVSGIVPYTPESLAMSQRSTLMPPPPIPDKQRRDSAESPTSAKVISSPKAGPSITAPVASTSIIESPLAADLHDMERQRRAELLARKAAVQASRKMKQSLSAASSSDTAPTGEPTPPAATEAVEDFLKSLAPAEAKEPSPLIVSSPGPIEEPAAMDVDQEPYKKATEQALEQSQELPPMSAVSEQFSMSSRSPVPETPPTSVESTSTSFPPSSTSTPGPGTPGLPGAASRRSLKRPVASDFVDVDPAPKRHESEGRPVQSNGVPRPVGITRRLNSGSGFSNIGSRRCVIDLSDSEDDGEAQEVEEHAIQSKAIPYSPAPLKPVSRLSTSSPAALMQKEMEIRKMRELIAQREEETRLRKLALAKSAAANAVGTSRSSTPAAQLPPNLNAEPDVVMAPPTPDIGEANGHAPQGSRSSESSTPPPSAEPSARTLAQSSIENGDIHAGPHETSVSDDDGQGKSPPSS